MSEHINRAYFSIIPANVRYDEGLIPSAKLLYSEITALCNDKGYCWASNEYFAKLYGVSKKTISIWIGQLKDKGYISSQLIYKEGSKEIKDRYLRISGYPMEEKVGTPMEEKVIDNNTLLNNTFNNTLSTIVDYFNEICGTSYKTTTKTTAKLIKARTDEGFVVDDFKKVIITMYNKWRNDPKMKEYIRPSTLFNGDKFEGYLNQYKGGGISGESNATGTGCMGDIHQGVTTEDDIDRVLRAQGRTAADLTETDFDY